MWYNACTTEGFVAADDQIVKYPGFVRRNLPWFLLCPGTDVLCVHFPGQDLRDFEEEMGYPYIGDGSDDVGDLTATLCERMENNVSRSSWRKEFVIFQDWRLTQNVPVLSGFRRGGGELLPST